MAALQKARNLRKWRYCCSLRPLAVNLSGRKCTLCGRMESGDLVVASQPRVVVGYQDARREPFTGPAAVGRPQRPHRTDNHANPDEPENDGKHVATSRQVSGFVQPFMRVSIVPHASTSSTRR